MIRLSTGTATLLGLQKSAVQEEPTTAYLMSGQGCSNNCSFCAQARSSCGTAAFLSRVTWPEFPMAKITGSLAAAHQSGKLQRVCIQVIHSPQAMEELCETLKILRESVPQIPISVSAAIDNVKQAAALFENGADTLNISLDGASREVFEAAKGKSWEGTWSLLRKAAEAFPGRIRTHIISGLGETEYDFVYTIQKCKDLEIGTGLFAFTPIKGTQLETRPQPPLNSYRRLQAANYLIATGYSRAGHFKYRPDGSIATLGIPAEDLKKILVDGKAFETSGCKGCNRPYYNESPRQVPFNYPRPLTEIEVEEAVRAVLSETEEFTA